MNLQNIECSVGEDLEKLYTQVFDEIYPHIKNQKKGILSTVIYIIIDKEQAKYICDYFKIQSTTLLDDDVIISSDVIGLFIINPNEKTQWPISLVKEGVKNVRKSFGSKLEDNDMKLFQIVIVGCLIVGAVACLKYLDLVREKNKRKQSESYKTQTPIKAPQPVDLCLVVPASLVRNARIDNLISVSNIEELIDSSIYFLCTSSKDANDIQNHLILTEEDIITVSDQSEVYIRIYIADGEEMMGKKVPYILKRNLPPNGGVIKELACLKYLSISGLDKFNRN